MPHTDRAQPPLRSDKIVDEQGRPILRFITFLESLHVNEILNEAELIADSAAQGALGVAIILINTQAARIDALTLRVEALENP